MIKYNDIFGIGIICGMFAFMGLALQGCEKQEHEHVVEIREIESCKEVHAVCIDGYLYYYTSKGVVQALENNAGDLRAKTCKGKSVFKKESKEGTKGTDKIVVQ